MSSKLSWLNPTRKPVPWVSGTLVILGFLLASFTAGDTGWWAILLTGLGTFGPGLLRELGWLHDKDEFQIQAARRAGYHAFLAVGFAAFIWIAFLRSAERHVKNLGELAVFFAALLWFTWMLSSLASYWGARKTAFRILVSYGGAWLLFVILSELEHPLGMLMEGLITLPFFGCALLSRRWPRAAGAVVLASSVFCLFLILRIHAQRNLGLVVTAETLVLFIAPLVAAGIALLLPEAAAGETPAS